MSEDKYLSAKQGFCVMNIPRTKERGLLGAAPVLEECIVFSAWPPRLTAQPAPNDTILRSFTASVYDG